ncbi:hypothetical protein BKA62DRAFT_713964 [Auriculariales sp. MPI-PUGE-AT-0066]|nr:hypothetical protein BKA62DRAFT_713964 [Auriculariales sp. MPI-PUGE-AT-0066]
MSTNANINSQPELNSPVREPFSYFVPAAWGSSNALQLAPSLDSPISSSSSHPSPTSMSFTEQFGASSRPTAGTNMLPAQNFFLPAVPQVIPSNAPSALPYGYNNLPYMSPSIQVHPVNASRSVAPSRRPSPPSPSSSLPSPNGRAPRAVPLHRGEACLHCRKRKMRCDGLKPTCGPCSRNGTECEYEISPYLRQIQQLQDEAVQLRARIAELEGQSPLSNASSISPLSPQSYMQLQPQSSPAGYLQPTNNLQPTAYPYNSYSPYTQQQQQIDIW